MQVAQSSSLTSTAQTITSETYLKSELDIFPLFSLTFPPRYYNIQFQHTLSKRSTIGVHPLKQEMYKGEYLVTGCILPSALWFTNNLTISLLPISHALEKYENSVDKNYSPDRVFDL